MTKEELLLLLGLCAAPLSACGGSGDGDATNVRRLGDVEGNGDGPSPVYALSTLVWGDTDTTGYVMLSDTLELGEPHTLADPAGAGGSARRTAPKQR